MADSTRKSHQILSSFQYEPHRLQVVMRYMINPYPAYKDSGVPWLGRIPEHWETKPLKRWVTMNGQALPETTPPDHEFRYLEIGSVGTGSLIQNAQQLRFGYAPSRARRIARKGDTIVSTVRTYLKAVYFIEEDAELVCSTGFAVLTPREGTVPKFVSYVAQSNPFTDNVTAESTGTAYPAIPEARLSSFCVPVPPYSEQAAIVRFLDHVNRRIRRYIHAKQKLITMLQEQKQAIIHNAVTGGLDLNVRLKPSGVPWMGDVPHDWEVRRLKSLVRRIDQGVSPQAENYLAEDGSWGVLKAGCVNHGVFRQLEHKRLPPGFTIDPNIVVREGDVLVSRACGSPHLVGSVGRVESLSYRLILSDKTFRPVFKSDVFPEYMVLAMNSRYYRQQVEQAISGAEGLANNLPLSSLRGFVFAIPPLLEQHRIAQHLHECLLGLLTTVNRTDRETSLLREYRTRLIADVVTGKLDVREAAAKLQEELEAAEPPDEDEQISDEEVEDEVEDELEV